jgi:single-stranded-DNA-specific exonuclease
MDWLIRPANGYVKEMAQKLRLSPLCAQVLINRGIQTTEQGTSFLRPKLNGLIEPERMPGLKQAVERIEQAIHEDKKLTIYGDYDVDGITGVAILWYILKLLGAKVDYYIPHRIEEGYGLNCEAIEQLTHSGTEVIITVDCGINSLEAAGRAGELGLDLIITDHHRPGSKLPKAAAIVHPMLEETYENPHSAGVMVAFKLAWGLANRSKTKAGLAPSLRGFLLDATVLTAIGTIADVVELGGENRIITSYGLKAAADCRLCGLHSLIESLSLTKEQLNSYEVGFRVAPVLNAAGRMGHARLAVELLTGTNPTQTGEIAKYLNEQNRKRKQCERKILKQVCEMITSKQLDRPGRQSFVLAQPDWHIGVIGIVASRIADKFGRPTILLNNSEDIAKGSARSIPGFDLLEAIESCSQHLVRFGGHSAAAGIRIEREKIEQFARDFEAYARRYLKKDDTLGKLSIDALTSVGELSPRVVRELQLLAPFGQGNPAPVFATTGVHLIAPPRRVGQRGEHLQLSISDEGSLPQSGAVGSGQKGAVRCIGFRMGELEKQLLERDFFDVAYEPKINNYNGSSSVEFVLTDVRFD